MAHMIKYPDLRDGHTLFDFYGNPILTGGSYASLTGAGETTTPGALTQAGPLTVNDTTGTGISLVTSGSGGTGIRLTGGASAGGISIVDNSTNGVNINANNAAGELSLSAGNEVVITTAVGSTGGIQVVDNGSGGITVGGMPVPLHQHSGHLAAPFTVPGSLFPYLTTASLDIGTWLILHTAQCVMSAGVTIEAGGTTGTATATFEGTLVGEVSATSSALDAPITLAFIATVTVAGTLVFEAISTGAGTISIVSVTPTSSLAKATGYTAIRIA